MYFYIDTRLKMKSCPTFLKKLNAKILHYSLQKFHLLP